MIVTSLRNGQRLCDIREGWNWTFMGQWLILTHPDHPPVVQSLSLIRVGDVIPLEKDIK